MTRAKIFKAERESRIVKTMTGTLTIQSRIVKTMTGKLTTHLK